ncbi:MAG: MBL fold metallo-hydrolase [Chloroflexi bacterium]|nr:MBL fold metallo-hydrolase [Chloroflexota bacterium]
MAASLTPVGEGTYVLGGGSNIGFMVQGGEALVVDAGLDADAARRALRALASLGAEPRALLLTHAHADHSGGAAALASRAGIPVLASPPEAAVARQPLLEPVYLYGGASPPPALRGKFLLAAPCPAVQEIEPGPLSVGEFHIDVLPLPGHAPGQVGFAWGQTLFCADAFFPEETLAKHGVPYVFDLDAALETLAALDQSRFAAYAAGHGACLAAVAAVTAANRERLLEVRAWVAEALRQPQDADAVAAGVANRCGLELTTPAQFLLTRATVLAALTSLQRAGQATHELRGNRLLWRRA